VGAWT